jgi:hypothetical protein
MPLSTRVYFNQQVTSNDSLHCSSYFENQANIFKSFKYMIDYEAILALMYCTYEHTHFEWSVLLEDCARSIRLTSQPKALCIGAY